MKNRKILYAFLGFLLGLGAPLGSLFYRALLTGSLNPAWFLSEFDSQSFFYIYMAATTPLVFTVFGFFIGSYTDRFEAQNESLEKMNILLKEQSIMDELTGFHNRRQIMTEIQKEIARARRYNHKIAGIMIDVDDFKKFNDQYGHLYGDYVLREVARSIDHCIRSTDILGRYGGDEFIIILPESNPETADIVASRIRNAIAMHDFEAKGEPVSVTVSMGIHFFEDMEKVDKISFIENIDQALFKAKDLRKNKAK